MVQLNTCSLSEVFCCVVLGKSLARGGGRVYVWFRKGELRVGVVSSYPEYLIDFMSLSIGLSSLLVVDMRGVVILYVAPSAMAVYVDVE